MKLPKGIISLSQKHADVVDGLTTKERKTMKSAIPVIRRIK